MLRRDGANQANDAGKMNSMIKVDMSRENQQKHIKKETRQNILHIIVMPKCPYWL